jgi:hypothetical protein
MMTAEQLQRVRALTLACVQAYVVHRVDERGDLLPWFLLVQTAAALPALHTVKLTLNRHAALQGALHASSLVLPIVAGWCEPRAVAGGNRTLVKSAAPLVALLCCGSRRASQWVAALVGFGAMLVAMGSLDYDASVGSAWWWLASAVLWASCVAGVLLGMAQQRTGGPMWTEMTLVSLACLALTTTAGSAQLHLADYLCLLGHFVLSAITHTEMRRMLASVRHDPVTITMLLSARRAFTVTSEKWLAGAPLQQSLAALLAVGCGLVANTTAREEREGGVRSRQHSE